MGRWPILEEPLTQLERASIVSEFTQFFERNHPDRRGGKLLFRWADHQREVGRSEDLLVDRTLNRRGPPCGSADTSLWLRKRGPPGGSGSNTSGVRRPLKQQFQCGARWGWCLQVPESPEELAGILCPSRLPCYVFFLCMLTNQNPNANQRNSREYFAQVSSLTNVHCCAATSERINH